MKDPMVTGLYWRKSAWNGLATKPVILRLDGDQLTLKTTESTVWQVPISETRCRFSSLGTMILTVNGQEYAFVAAGSGVSLPFSKDLLEELAQGNTNMKDTVGSDTAVRLGTAASALGGAAAVAGAPIATAAYAAAAAENISAWSNEFTSRHLLDESDKNVNPGKNLLLLLIGGVVIGIALTLLFRVVLKY